MTPIEAHQRSSLNRDEVTASELCGCFYCLAVFGSPEIDEWWDDGRTAVCPRCGIDSVLPGETNKEFLLEMYEYWFGNKI